MRMMWAVCAIQRGGWGDNIEIDTWWVVRVFDTQALATELATTLTAHVGAKPAGDIGAWLERLWELDAHSSHSGVAAHVIPPRYGVDAMQVWDGTEPAFRETVYGGAV